MTLSHARTELEVLEVHGEVGEHGAVEFIDRPTSVDANPDDVTSGSAWSWVGIVALIVAGVWAVSAVGAADPVRRGQPVVADESHVGEVPPPLRPSWVITRSGPQPSLGLRPDVADTTLVYLSTDGLPVAVSLSTGGIDVVDVDPERRSERLAVTAASRVILDRNDASGAVVFDMITGPNDVRELCARRVGSIDRNEACAGGAVAVGEVVVDGYDSGRHWALAPLLEEGAIVGGRLVTDDGFWIPLPVRSSIWVIGPPERGGASADIGRL